ncbi:hypothetical protein IKG73_02625 [Candidatus Saccharibacteria bacterium]|nr:hypothetical protein [Candidatus Saccharibacteria bacterium]
MRRKALTSDQVWGRAPITKEDLVAAAEQAKYDYEHGLCIDVPETYAEFRKVILGLDDEVSTKVLTKRHARS